jgi:hypothetical protein
MKQRTRRSRYGFSCFRIPEKELAVLDRAFAACRHFFEETDDDEKARARQRCLPAFALCTSPMLGSQFRQLYHGEANGTCLLGFNKVTNAKEVRRTPSYGYQFRR